MYCVRIYFLFLFFSCQKKELSTPETTFTFDGKWRYLQKVYQFATEPFQLVSKGEGCNGATNFIFTPNEFEIQVFDGDSCENQFYYVLSYVLQQDNDSIYRLNSNKSFNSL